MPFLFPDLNIIIHAKWLWEAGGTKNFINMKRIIITFIAAIAFAAGAMAEQDNRVVTCQHGSTIRAYYGAFAFRSAIADAANGDIITLTAGEFNGCDVNKAVTIRGEGWKKTTIKSMGSFYIPQGSEHALYLEGINLDGINSNSFNGNDGSEKVVISKCRIYRSGRIDFSKCTATIMQSIVFASTTLYAGEYATVTCLNSLLLENLSTSYSASYTPERNGHWYISNCAIYGNNVNELRCSTIKNSTFRVACSLEEGTNTSSHCLVPEGSSGFFNSYYVKPEADPWDENDLAWNNIFGEWWEITNDNAKATYLGTDGTQVGVYGGTYPYNTTPDLPTVKWLDVTESYKNGKLNVQINVE